MLLANARASVSAYKNTFLADNDEGQNDSFEEKQDEDLFMNMSMVGYPSLWSDPVLFSQCLTQ